MYHYSSFEGGHYHREEEEEEVKNAPKTTPTDKCLKCRVIGRMNIRLMATSLNKCSLHFDFGQT